MPDQLATTLVVLDFETTGLSPLQGDRAIEIGAVLIEDGEITARFSELMHPGFKVSRFIEDYTGISNQMLASARPCHEVMNQFADFIGQHNLVAHNASFDKRFLDEELNRINRGYTGEFSCSLLLARRLYQDAPNHQLGNLVKYKNIPNNGVFHRALADSEMTARLWLAMLQDLKIQYGVNDPSFKLIQTINKKSKNAVHGFLTKQLEKRELTQSK